MVSLRVEGLRKTFPGVVALDRVDLRSRESEYVVILGPTGSGKTTLLRTIAGLARQDAGHIYFDDQLVDGLPPFERGVAYLPQTYSLFGHLTVRENVEFGPTVQDWDPRRREAITREMLDLVHLSDRAASYPAELSGGMQQRVALARALGTQARLLLLDEPLRALDARLRIELRQELRSLAKGVGITTVHVTHDQEEAISIADRIAVLHRGRVVQVGTPREVYESPASPFVANFVGEANFFEGTLEGSGDRGSVVRLPNGRLVRGRPSGFPPGAPVVMAAKTDRCAVSAANGAEGNAFPGRVVRALYMGRRTSLEVETDTGTLKAQVPSARAAAFPDGTSVTVTFPPDQGLMFPAPPEGLTKALEVD